MTTSLYTVVKTSDAKDADGSILLPISRNDGKKGKSGLCIQVPEISDSVLTLVFNHEKGKKFFISALNKVRAAIASELNAFGSVITSDKIGIDGILAALDKHTESQRLTQEKIAEWFAADMAPVLLTKINAKYPGIAKDKADRIMTPYLEGYKECAARNKSLKSATRDNCLVQLAALDDDYMERSPLAWVAARIAEILPTIGEATDIAEAL